MRPLASNLRCPLHGSRFIAAIIAFTVALPPGAPRARAEEGGPVPESRIASAESDGPKYRLDPVVVTAERMPLRLRDVPSDVTVLSAERLARERPFFLADALRAVPAVDVQRGGGLGKITDVRLRGADPRHTLILFDGIPLNGPWIGNFDFADIMGAGQGRVEIFGGPASSLYGSGASGGVIQVLSPETTRAAEGSIFAEFGEDGTRRQGAAWRGMLGSTHLSGSGVHLGSDGTQPRDAYAGWNGQAHLEAPAVGGTLRVSALGTRGDKELPYDFFFDSSDLTLSPYGSNKQIHDPNNRERDRLLAGSASFTRPLSTSTSLEGEFSGLGGRIDNENQADGDARPDYQETHLKNGRGIAALRVRVAPAEGVRGTVGAEYSGENVNRDDKSNYGGFPSETSVDERVHSRALYAEGHALVQDRLLLDAGVRLEDHSRYGSYGVPRVALGYRIEAAGLKLRAGYGRAFTAPTLTDLYYPGYGSSTLKPERSTTWEAGFDGAWFEDRLSAKATAYRTVFLDLIESNSFFQAGNVGRARVEGQEYSARLSPSGRATLEASAVHLRGENLVTGGRLAKRPQWRTSIALIATPRPGVTAMADWKWVDSMLDPFVFIDVTGSVLDGDVPGHPTLNFGLNLSLARWAPADLRFRLANALDREYSEVKGFPALGRALTVGMTWTP